MHTQQSEKQDAPREPTADELRGIAWWNSLTEDLRLVWLNLSKGDSVAEAWAYYKSLTKGRE